MPNDEKNSSLQCYLIPSSPNSILLPAECIAEVIAKPEIDAVSAGTANWMVGHTTWRNQRLPIMSYAALQDPNLDESKRRKAHLVILNPVASAARKAYSSLLCYGEVNKIDVDASAKLAEIPEKLDKRYVDAMIEHDGQTYVVPKLSAISVAFSYF